MEDNSVLSLSDFQNMPPEVLARVAYSMYVASASQQYYIMNKDLMGEFLSFRNTFLSCYERLPVWLAAWNNCNTVIELQNHATKKIKAANLAIHPN